MANPVLVPGALAPDFVLQIADGTWYRLGARASAPTQQDALALPDRATPVVVYFYPKDDTPGCTNEACDFTSLHTQFDGLGASVVGISADSVASHRKFAQKYDLNLTLAADTDKATAQAWGVWRTKVLYGKESLGIVRSTFLVAADGRIAQIWDGVKVRRKTASGEARHADDVAAALAKLK